MLIITFGAMRHKRNKKGFVCSLVTSVNFDVCKYSYEGFQGNPKIEWKMAMKVNQFVFEVSKVNRVCKCYKNVNLGLYLNFPASYRAKNLYCQLFIREDSICKIFSYILEFAELLKICMLALTHTFLIIFSCDRFSFASKKVE